jgi:hypothetical protein
VGEAVGAGIVAVAAGIVADAAGIVAEAAGVVAAAAGVVAAALAGAGLLVAVGSCAIDGGATPQPAINTAQTHTIANNRNFTPVLSVVAYGVLYAFPPIGD